MSLIKRDELMTNIFWAGLHTWLQVVLLVWFVLISVCVV